MKAAASLKRVVFRVNGVRVTDLDTSKVSVQWEREGKSRSMSQAEVRI